MCGAFERAGGGVYHLPVPRGTSEKKKLSEDELLAEKVEGIDLIVSGHTHTTLTEPIAVNNTYIVSAGPYCENLGSITIEWTEGGERTLTDYHLTPIDETLPVDGEITAMVERWKGLVGGPTWPGMA